MLYGTTTSLLSNASSLPDVIYSCYKYSEKESKALHLAVKSAKFGGKQEKKAVEIVGNENYLYICTPKSQTVTQGEVPEWSIGPHSKCGVRATVPGVRIPPSPQRTNEAKRCRIFDTFCFWIVWRKFTCRHSSQKQSS